MVRKEADMSNLASTKANDIALRSCSASKSINVLDTKLDMVGNEDDMSILASTMANKKVLRTYCTTKGINGLHAEWELNQNKEDFSSDAYFSPFSYSNRKPNQAIPILAKWGKLQSETGQMLKLWEPNLLIPFTL
ncbi:hypothetical protein V6N11_057908 [Hibiscus sabdariffa]|uniref:Uncharacterized protein n=1 Tax=Hibiscus sabdariffa TaxID=183260 RepID=A0ABR2P3Z0_9ROSI